MTCNTLVTQCTCQGSGGLVAGRLAEGVCGGRKDMRPAGAGAIYRCTAASGVHVYNYMGV